MKLRHLTLAYLTPRIWQKNAKRRVNALLEYSAIELDSAWQSINLIRNVTDQKLKSYLLNHACEEVFHSKLFKTLALKNTESPNASVFLERKSLIEFEKEFDTDEILRKIQIGEEEVLSDFQVLQQSVKNEDIREVLTRILKDEEHHADSFQEVQVKNNSFKELKLSIVHSFKILNQFLEKFGNHFFKIPMMLLYMLGGIFYFTWKKRIQFTDQEQLELVKEQIAISNKAIIQLRK